jgi:hypothetical protein
VSLRALSCSLTGVAVATLLPLVVNLKRVGSWGAGEVGRFCLMLREQMMNIMWVL